MLRNGNILFRLFKIVTQLKLKCSSNNQIFIFLKCKSEGRMVTNGRNKDELCDGIGGLNGACCDPYYCEPGEKKLPSVPRTWRCTGRCRKDDCTD